MIHRLADGMLAPRGGFETKTRWWHIAIILVAGTLLVLFRLPVERWNVPWAEDGADFLSGALLSDPFTIVEPYYGYLHVVPRLLAALVTAVAPLDWMPLTMTVLTAIVTAAVASTVFVFARSRIRSTTIVALLTLAVLVLPIAGGEVVGSAANLHWYLSFGAFWAAIVTPRTRLLTAVQCVIVAAAVLSDPLASALLFPLIVVRVAGVRPFRSRAQAVTWTYVGASLIQGAAVILQTQVDEPRQFSEAKPGPLAFLEVYSGKVVLDSIVGVRAAARIIDATAWPGLVVVLLLVAAAIGVVASLDRERRSLLIAFAVASVGFALLAMFFAWNQVMDFPVRDITAGDRYWVLPVLLLIGSYAIGVDHLATRLGPARSWIPLAALALVVLLPGVTNYRLLDVRAGAPDWRAGVTEAAELCHDDPSRERAGIQIAPPWFRPAVVPCTILEASRPQ